MLGISHKFLTKSTLPSIVLESICLRGSSGLACGNTVYTEHWPYLEFTKQFDGNTNL